jgi:hypothetical protein
MARGWEGCIVRPVHMEPAAPATKRAPTEATMSSPTPEAHAGIGQHVAGFVVGAVGLVRVGAVYGAMASSDF